MVLVRALLSKFLIKISLSILIYISIMHPWLKYICLVQWHLYSEASSSSVLLYGFLMYLINIPNKHKTVMALLNTTLLLTGGYAHGENTQ